MMLVRRGEDKRCGDDGVVHGRIAEKNTDTVSSRTSKLAWWYRTSNNKDDKEKPQNVPTVPYIKSFHLPELISIINVPQHPVVRNGSSENRCHPVFFLFECILC